MGQSLIWPHFTAFVYLHEKYLPKAAGACDIPNRLEREKRTTRHVRKKIYRNYGERVENKKIRSKMRPTNGLQTISGHTSTNCPPIG